VNASIQKERAAMAGLSVNTILSAEHGQHQPSFRTMKAIARALGVDPKELFANTG
jgi:transcriptional regulator with XRE-family HTH domain